MRTLHVGLRREDLTLSLRSTDFWTAWVTDPDGHRIELVQWPDGHPEGMTRADLPAPGETR